jgi:hypothetical protein
MRQRSFSWGAFLDAATRVLTLIAAQRWNVIVGRLPEIDE